MSEQELTSHWISVGQLLPHVTHCSTIGS